MVAELGVTVVRIFEQHSGTDSQCAKVEVTRIASLQVTRCRLKGFLVVLAALVHLAAVHQALREQSVQLEVILTVIKAEEYFGRIAHPAHSRFGASVEIHGLVDVFV